ncbi:MAG: flavin reductase family protein [Candidatus Margulisbacteria bacterium]|nr:flavin reductase family protein [Candidatus Margulisiibacteriota bacterium]
MKKDYKQNIYKKNYKKVHLKPGTMVYPLPAAIISCGILPREYNILTISWIGTICSEPPMLSISVRPVRYSYDIIKKNKEFVVNLPDSKMARTVDLCGVRSGRDINKWEVLKLKPCSSKIIKTPQIENCPVSIECMVKQIIPLGSHDCFIAEVVNVSVHAYLVNKNGYCDLEKADLLCYMHGAYHDLGKTIGRFGYSVKKS